MDLQINQQLLKVMEIMSPHHQVQVKTQYYKIIPVQITTYQEESLKHHKHQNQMEVLKLSH